MKRLLLIALYCSLIVILASCGPAATSTPQVMEGTPSAPALETATETETASPEPTLTPLELDTPTPALPTETPSPTATFGPTPTETLLPTMELPTLAAVEPTSAVWDGVPTYLADSQPGFYFRLTYDPRIWAQAQDAFGQPALGHREIEYCILSPALARGLTPGIQVEHDIRQIGDLFFEVNVALQNGVRQFVTYQATDTIIFTSFRVDFVDRIDDCLAAAEIPLATFTSVPQSEATPVP